MGLWCPGCRNISLSNWTFWGYNGCVETWCTGMQQSGFDWASNQLSSLCSEQIAVWMMFNHLADRLHLDSSFRKLGCCWCWCTPSFQLGQWTLEFLGGGNGGAFSICAFPLLSVHHFSCVHCWKPLLMEGMWFVCVLLRYHSGASASNTDLKGSRWTYSLSHMSLMMQHRQYSVILITDFVHIGQTTHWLFLVVVSLILLGLFFSNIITLRPFLQTSGAKFWILFWFCIHLHSLCFCWLHQTLLLQSKYGIDSTIFRPRGKKTE